MVGLQILKKCVTFTGTGDLFAAVYLAWSEQGVKVYMLSSVCMFLYLCVCMYLYVYTCLYTCTFGHTVNRARLNIFCGYTLLPQN